VTVKIRSNPKPRQYADCGEMHPHTKFGVPSYQSSGDTAHYMFSKMATILKMWELTKAVFSIPHQTIFTAYNC
jgi:hypothetical protein